ncbi:hypothetical protein HNQ81_001011 [Desulfoprunum benzoelyticum]|jgi:hypothetical protein|uniref:Uncharacterized protein n=1 Tax=Desulfoprunum benzoelyticum TaxID=1506996 RepID=A0A840UX86_9BACT|nr:hypothetical protein [Desulfoprunum benzoelyticum]
MLQGHTIREAPARNSFDSFCRSAARDSTKISGLSPLAVSVMKTLSSSLDTAGRQPLGVHQTGLQQDIIGGRVADAPPDSAEAAYDVVSGQFSKVLAQFSPPQELVQFPFDNDLGCLTQDIGQQADSRNDDDGDDPAGQGFRRPGPAAGTSVLQHLIPRGEGDAELRLGADHDGLDDRRVGGGRGLPFDDEIGARASGTVVLGDDGRR